MDEKSFKVEKPRLTIVNIATNHYVHYLFDFIKSIPKKHLGKVKVRLLIFTDQPDLVLESVKSITNVQIEVVPIPSYSWPEATLFRYELIASGNYIKDEIIAYIDADSLVLDSELIPNLLQCKNELHLVRHPGYVYPKFRCVMQRPARSIKRIIELLMTRIKERGVGTWETDSSSLAYVEPELRKNYFCGGIWWGPATSVLKMSQLLAKRTRQDYENTRVARWHDESHLNWFAAYSPNEVKITPSATLFSPSISVTPRSLAWVEAVDK